MALDTLISQISYRARLLERALHDPGPWTFRLYIGDEFIEVPARKVFLGDGVHFEGDVPPMPPEEAMVQLCWQGEPQTFKRMKLHAIPFTVHWEIRGFVDDYQRSA